MLLFLQLQTQNFLHYFDELLKVFLRTPISPSGYNSKSLIGQLILSWFSSINWFLPARGWFVIHLLLICFLTTERLMANYL